MATAEYDHITGALDYAVNTLKQRHANGHDLILATLTHCCTLAGLNGDHYHDGIEQPDGEGENTSTQGRANSEATMFLEISRENLERNDAVKRTGSRAVAAGAVATAAPEKSPTAAADSGGEGGGGKWGLLREKILGQTKAAEMNMCTDVNLNLDFPFLSLHLQQLGLHTHLWPQVFSNILLLIQQLPHKLEEALNPNPMGGQPDSAPSGGAAAAKTPTATKATSMMTDLFTKAISEVREKRALQRMFTECRHTLLVLMGLLKELLTQVGHM
jgi:hypothetical protein